MKKDPKFKIKDIKPGFIYWWHPMDHFSIVLTKPIKTNDLYFCDVWFFGDQKTIRVFTNGLVMSLNTSNDIRWME